MPIGTIYRNGLILKVKAELHGRRDLPAFYGFRTLSGKLFGFRMVAIFMNGGGSGAVGIQVLLYGEGRR